MDFDPLMKNGTKEKKIEIESSFHQPCTQKEFDSVYDYVKAEKPGLRKSLRKHTHCNVGSGLVKLCPVLSWLPRYNWKKDLLSDIVSGFTVAIMHIPQGMAYSSLGAVPPIVGIYMAFFPVLVYFIFGTSRHVSMGTFAVVCMMTSKPVLLYSMPADALLLNSTSPTHTHTHLAQAMYTPIQVATIVCFVVGFWQMVLGVLRLGSLSVLMSEVLVSGFTTGAAVLVLTSQMKHVFGIKLPRHIGPLKVIYTYVDLFNMIDQTNLVAFGITASVVVVLYSFNEFIKPRLKCISFPIPMEMITVVIGVVVSKYFHLEDKFKVSVVGEIPTGLPEPALPPVMLIPNVLVDGLVIAVVAFSINISMASIFARKENYKVDANQELLASGLGNMAGSFFSCLPFAASLSRSLIQHGVGGKTQLASVISCSLLLLVLLFIGPFFEPLPHCVLAGIILTALKGMLKQVYELPVAWRLSRRDGVIWLVTFLAVVLVDIDVGLGVGIIVSLASILLASHKPYIHQLGHLPDTEIYLEMDRYHKASPIESVIVVRICGGLHFANKEYVQSKIKKLLKKQMKEESVNSKISSVVIDMSAVIFIDPVSCKAMLSLEQDLKSQQISLCLAKCSARLCEQLKQCQFLVKFPETQMFPSLHDAVSFGLNSNVTTVT